MGLVLDWKKKLGYKKDPFERAVVAPVGSFVVGLNELKEKFNLFLIKNEQFGTISGDSGTGKTTFLSWIEEQLTRGYKPQYLDANKAKKQLQLLDNLLEDNISFFAKKLGKTLEKPVEQKYQLLIKKLGRRPHVLLVDNAGSLGQDSVQLLADILQKTKTHLIVVDTKEKLKNFGIKADRLGLRMPTYTKENLMAILRKRIEAVGGVGTFPFDEKELDKLIKKANGNPSELLKCAKDRAIELSLKVTKPPKRTSPKKSPSKREEPQGDVKRIGFLNIKIDRGETKKAERPPLLMQEPKSPPSETINDAEQLHEILDQVEVMTGKPEEEVVVTDGPEKRRKGKTSHDEFIAGLADEFKPMKKSASKSKKKIAKKKKK